MTVQLQKLLDNSIRNMKDGIHSVVKESALEMIKRAYEEKIYVQITSGFRSFAEQDKLFAQGRTDKTKPIVTNARAGQSNHNFGLAIDYVLLSEDGLKAIWTVNKDWKRVAAIGKELGFKWGGDWTSFKDYPHLEMMGGLSMKDLQNGRKPVLKSKVNNTVEKEEVEKPKEPVKPKPKPPVAIPPYPNKVFKVKSPLMTGKDVERLQRALGMKEKDVDGKYGKDTAALVKAYQKRKGLKADGIVGKETWNLLF